MRQVEIVKNTVAAKRSVRVGDIVPLDDAEAQFLIHCGKAKAYTPPPSPSSPSESPETEETPAPRRRGRRQHEETSQ